MQERFASTLGSATVAIALASAAALVGGKSYAETPTIDNTPFVSTRTRAEVVAEVLSARGHLMNTEWAMQANDVQLMQSGYTRAEATAAYMASRKEASAFNSEDSGSMYLAQRAAGQHRSTMLAAASR